MAASRRVETIARHVNTPTFERDNAHIASASCGGTPPKKVWYAPNKFEAYGEEEIQAVVECLRDGWLAPGPRTDEFEEKVAALFGKKCGLMVNSGSSANLLGLCALGLQKGDEIVTPACTFSTSIAPMEQLGLKPVFIDVEPGRYVPTVDAILAAITPKTKCCFLPNLIGSKIDWKDLRARVPKGIWLFEDSADTITYTPESDVSIISFYASHIITAGGTGGVVMFNDQALKDRATMFRDWGRIGNNSEDVSERFSHDVDGIEYDFKFLYGCLGYNMKACEMNAAFGLAQLKKLDKFKAMRKANINRYCERLAGTSYVLPHRHNDFDWLAFPLMHKDRKGVLRFLESNEVQIRVCFAGNITRHPAYRHYLKDFPGSDEIMADAFLIGAHHGLTFVDIDRVCDLLIEYDQKKGNVQMAAMAQASTEKERDSVSLDF
jgi:CDP-6-deoxy-D-xylo-4-hexulose-3-dehydrase